MPLSSIRHIWRLESMILCTESLGNMPYLCIIIFYRNTVKTVDETVFLCAASASKSDVVMTESFGLSDKINTPTKDLPS